MINGVMHIVAAVLFAVVAMNRNMDMIWFCVAAVYFAVGVLNLIIHAIKVKRMENAAKKVENKKNSPVDQKVERDTSIGG
jgi:predicted membrane protein